MSTDEHHPPTAYDNPPHGDNHPRHEQRQPTGAESPHNLLAVHDPSRRRQTPRPAPARGGGVTVQWLRPTELATRIAGRTAARAVVAHAAAHRQARAELRTALSTTRARLAPLTAFGQHASSDRSTLRRPPMS